MPNRSRQRRPFLPGLRFSFLNQTQKIEIVGNFNAKTQRRKDAKKSREKGFLSLCALAPLRFCVKTILILASVSCSFPTTAVIAAAVPLKNYSSRLAQAENLVEALTEGEPAAERVTRAMAEIKRLLPPREEVESNGQVFPVDNHWLHEAAEKVIKNADADVEQRRSLLVELLDRLSLLRESVEAQPVAPKALNGDRRAQLERILARPEYRPEAEKESSIRSLMRRIRRAIVDFLSRFRSEPQQPPNSPRPGGGGGVVRALMLLLLLGALLFGLATLLKRLRLRRKSKPKKEEVREVLGEEITGDLTAADLFARAAELARQGDYRAAIRRAYISVLFELEQRGKLRLHRAKTNRDYLDALRRDSGTYPAFSTMTGAYERVWYGEEGATNVEFEQFIQVYRRLGESPES